MKADKDGTWSEQVRARAGWLRPSERWRGGVTGACSSCGWLSTSATGRGWFCDKLGVSTARGAVCRDYRAVVEDPA